MKAILLAIFCAAAARSQTADAKPKPWNRQAAGAYLDARMAWWESWPSAMRDHETFCVSCHTSLPYALARPTLRSALDETGPAPAERKFLDNILKRLSLWDEVQPFYSDAKNGAPKSAEARGTEAVMNAVILARYDVPEARDALRKMWALQIPSGEKAGSWTWLNFHNEPWEADDSAFWGAALAGVAAGASPDREFQSNVTLLAAYLQREQRTQSTLNRAVALWASGKTPQLLTEPQRASIVEDILAKQRQDGGWSESSLVRNGWKRKDGTPMEESSDGYGTGLMVVALRESGARSAQTQIAKAMEWLARNQDAAGRWIASSMNKKRDPESDAGRFMTDAATAYAVLALSGR